MVALVIRGAQPHDAATRLSADRPGRAELGSFARSDQFPKLAKTVGLEHKPVHRRAAHSVALAASRRHVIAPRPSFAASSNQVLEGGSVWPVAVLADDHEAVAVAALPALLFEEFKN